MRPGVESTNRNSKFEHLRVVDNDSSISMMAKFFVSIRQIQLDAAVSQLHGTWCVVQWHSMAKLMLIRAIASHEKESER